MRGAGGTNREGASYTPTKGGGAENVLAMLMGGGGGGAEKVLR